MPRNGVAASAAPAASFHATAAPSSALPSRAPLASSSSAIAAVPPASAPIIQSAADREKQSEELEVLRAIYPDELKDVSVPEAIAAISTVAASAASSSAADSAAASVPSATSFASAFRIDLGSGFDAVALLPLDYPSRRPPLLHLQHSSRALSAAELAALDEMRSTLYDAAAADAAADEREVVLFNWLDFVKTRIVDAAAASAATSVTQQSVTQTRQEHDDAALAAAMEEAELHEQEDAQQRVSSFADDDDGDAEQTYEYKPYVASSSSSSPGSSSSAPSISILSGDPVTDRRSTFLAHAAAVTCVADVKSVLADLKSQSKIARASHPAIFAYVITEPTSGVAAVASAASGGIVRRESDDCGESGAGARLSHLLERMGVSNLIVVVTRWYGGIQLGADRWRHINHVARTVIEQHLAQQAAAMAHTQAAHAAKNAGGKGKKGGKH